MANNEQFGAFISYSRGGSGQLASDLQSGIERFGKPWNKLRAVRVFRDDSSMSANPALWSTIVAGLTESEWLVLLASPEAAASEYVNKEVAWWVQHKSADRILLVRAGGDIEWDPSGGDRPGGDFHHARATAIPPALFGAYAEEPRWIDLTWYAEPDSMGKADPRFNERIVDLASAIRGIPRDTLIGENVAQHRKTRRLTRGAIAGLATLLVLSLAAGSVALAQKSEATRQRDTAETQATIATARQLAATGEQLAETDLQPALQTAAYGYMMNPDSVTEESLFNVNAAGGQLVTFLDAGAEVTATAATNEGQVIVAGTEDGRVMSWQVPDRQPVEVMRLTGPVDYVGVSDDGLAIAASTAVPDGTSGAAEILEQADPTSSRVQDETDTQPSQSTSTSAAGDAAVSVDGAVTPVDYAIRGISPSGTTLVGQRRDEPESAVLLRGLRDPAQAVTEQLPTENNTFALSANDEFLLPSDETLVVWNCAAGLRLDLRTKAVSSFSLNTWVGGQTCLEPTVSPDGAFFTAAGNINPLGIVPVPQSVPGAEPTLFASMGTSSPPPDLALSNQGKALARAADGRIYVGLSGPSRESPAPPQVLEGSGQVETGTLHFAGDNHLISASGTSVALWSLNQTSRVISTLDAEIPSVIQACGGDCRAVVVSPDGSKAVVFDRTGLDDMFHSTMLVADFSEGTSRVIGDYLTGDVSGYASNFMQLRNNHLLPSAAVWLDDDRLAVYSIYAGRTWVLSGPLLDKVDYVVDMPVPGGLTDQSRASMSYRDGTIAVAVGTTIMTIPADARSVDGSVSYPGGEFLPDGANTIKLTVDQEAESQVTRVVAFNRDSGDTFLDTTVPGQVVRAMPESDGQFVLFRVDPRGSSRASLPVTRLNPESGTEAPIANLTSGSYYIVTGANGEAVAEENGQAVLMRVPTQSKLALVETAEASKRSNSMGFSPSGETVVIADAAANKLLALTVGQEALLESACALSGADMTDQAWERITGTAPARRPQCGSRVEAKATPDAKKSDSTPRAPSDPQNAPPQQGSTTPPESTNDLAPATPTYTFYGRDTTQYGEPFTSYLVIRRSGEEVKFLEDPANAQPSCFIGRQENPTTLTGLYLPPRQALVEASEASITLAETAQGVTWERPGAGTTETATLRTPSPADEARLKSAVDACDPSDPKPWGRPS